MSDIKRLLGKSIKSRTLFTDIFGYSLTLTGFADKKLAGKVTMYKAYSWLRKRFNKYIGQCDIPEGHIANKNYVWVCWFQGIENAPQIVKDCYASIQYWLKDREIVLITSENFSDYVSIPDYIIDKWKKGIISNTHFSDILRIELIIKYGGLWLDATTYLTGPLPEYVERTDFFVYRDGWMNNEMINMGSWFIYSRLTNNHFLIETRALLYRYWEKYNRIKNYFLMHMFFRMVTDAYPDEWDKVPAFNQIDQHFFMNELDKEFDETRCHEILQLTSIHKLTYKVDYKNIKDATAYRLDKIYSMFY